jgi:hypothetical protein
MAGTLLKNEKAECSRQRQYVFGNTPVVCPLIMVWVNVTVTEEYGHVGCNVQ